MGNSKFGALVLIIILGSMIGLYPAAMAEGAEQTAVGNEEIVVDYDRPVSVDKEGVSYNETVNVRASGSTLEEGTDYRWNATNGSVLWENTSATTDGQQAYIDYEVEQITKTTNRYADLLSVLSVPLAFLILLVLGYTAIEVWS